MEQRERLIEIIQKSVGGCARNWAEVIADGLLANGWIRPPCKVGDWIWYIYRNEINKSKVEEIQYNASKHGYYSYNFLIYAYDFKNKRQVTYYPINETHKNKSNINEVEGMDFGEDVFVFTTKEEADRELERRKNEFT